MSENFIKKSLLDSKKINDFCIAKDAKLKKQKRIPAANALAHEIVKYIDNILIQEECSTLLIEYRYYIYLYTLFESLHLRVNILKDCVGFNYAGVKFIAIQKSYYDSLMVLK